MGGKGGMRASGVVLAVFDDHGEPHVESGIEVEAFTCQGCHHIRLRALH
jgi:hypothetical protein